MPRPSAFVAHSGGPTTVLNASLQGLIEGARRANLAHLWAGRGGLGGVLRGDVVDLLAVPRKQIAGFGEQAGSVIGSFRGAILKQDFARTIKFFRDRDIRYCLYTGGNGSMGTAMQIAVTAIEQGYELATIGIPKTVDNDICETDHCPGFGSAAKFVTMAVREIGLDQRALPSPISIVEVMGRNTGWLAAACILARERDDDPPHFIYVPESPFDPEEFVTRADCLLRKRGWLVGVVAEGLKDVRGRMIGAAGASNRDAKGRPLAGNVSAHLAGLVSRRLRVRARSEKPGLLCRAFSPCQSRVDAAEAYAIGEFAMQSALKGNTDVMIAIRRLDSKRYRSTLACVPLQQVAERERPLPIAYVRGSADIRETYRDYVAPLVGERLEPAVHL